MYVEWSQCMRASFVFQQLTCCFDIWIQELLQLMLLTSASQGLIRIEEKTSERHISTRFCFWFELEYEIIQEKGPGSFSICSYLETSQHTICLLKVRDEMLINSMKDDSNPRCTFRASFVWPTVRNKAFAPHALYKWTLISSQWPCQKLSAIPCLKIIVESGKYLSGNVVISASCRVSVIAEHASMGWEANGPFPQSPELRI